MGRIAKKAKHIMIVERRHNTNSRDVQAHCKHTIANTPNFYLNYLSHFDMASSGGDLVATLR